MKISKLGLFCVFILLTTFLIVPLQGEEPQPLTAHQIIERIQDHTGGHDSAVWKGHTVDTFKAGDPDTPVTGIATTFSATMDVLERAAAQNTNLIIAHEPTFYNHEDETTWLGDDPVFKRKLAYIQQHRLVIWRFHDKWHNSPDQPDGILKGMVGTLGWEKFQSPNDPHVFTFPETTLDDLARKIKVRLHIRALRVLGNPNLKITRVAFLPGASGRYKHIKALQSEDIEVLIAGESSEWEGVLYVTDAIGQEKRKGLILMGHVVSEELGMKECANWLKSIIQGSSDSVYRRKGNHFGFPIRRKLCLLSQRSPRLQSYQLFAIGMLRQRLNGFAKPLVLRNTLWYQIPMEQSPTRS